MILAIPHRGVTQYAPENTIGAFQAAVSLGYKAVEIDIRQTQDNRIVVVHDSNLTHLTLGHLGLLNGRYPK